MGAGKYARMMRRRQVVPTPPLNNDMLFWWDFADTSTIDLTGTDIDEVRSKDPFSVALNGGWKATPLTSAPTYDAVNKRAEFSGTMDLISEQLTDAAGPTGEGPNGFFCIVCEFDTMVNSMIAGTSRTTGVLMRAAGSALTPSDLLDYGGRQTNSAGLDTYISSAATTYNASQKYLITGISSDTDRFLRMDGSQIGTDANGGAFPRRNTSTSTRTRAFMGGLINNISVLQRRPGKIYEWIAYQAYDGTTMLQVEQYLTDKWNL
jgi:hypothetical protein